MLISLIIIIFILFGANLGMKRGALKEFITVVGFIIVFFIAYTYKNPLANILYKYLPFFEFDGLTALNILLYEALSMLIIIMILGVLLRILISLSSKLEKLFDATVVLGIPSKIVGAILGIIEYIGITFIILYFVSVSYNVKDKSKVANIILNDTVILSDVCRDTLKTLEEVENIKEKYDKNGASKQINKEILDLLIEKKIISEEKVDELLVSNKLKI